MPRLLKDPFTPAPIVMPNDFDGAARRILGPKCDYCTTTEARCAYHRGCCDACTHTFGEPYARRAS